MAILACLYFPWVTRIVYKEKNLKRKYMRMEKSHLPVWAPQE